MTDLTWGRDRLNEQLKARLQHQQAARRMAELLQLVESPQRAWESHQKRSRQAYVDARQETMLQILWDARCGRLSREWRSEAIQRVEEVALDMARADPAFFDAERLAVLSIVSMDVQPWEPGAGVGWRAALDGWYAEMARVDAEAIEQVADGQRRWTLEEESVSSTKENALYWARAVERYRRMKDEHGALYYAGLAGGGVDVDWRQWFRNRIASWLVELEPDEPLGFSRPARETLEQLEQGALDSYEKLPDCWLT